MNIKNMSCTSAYGVLEVIYDCGDIRSSVYNDRTGDISFYYRDGKIIQHNIANVVEPGAAYLSQYGISISADGASFFIHSWEKGLFCFDIQDGSCIWHSAIKKACHLVVRKDMVICRFGSQGVYLMNSQTGEVLKRYPLNEGASFLPLTDNYYLVGPKRGKYIIIDCELNTVTNISCQKLNPHEYDVFILLQAYLTNNGILINGFEYSYVDKEKRKQDGRPFDTDEFRFYRLIDVDIPATQG